MAEKISLNEKTATFSNIIMNPVTDGLRRASILGIELAPLSRP